MTRRTPPSSLKITQHQLHRAMSVATSNEAFDVSPLGVKIELCRELAERLLQSVDADIIISRALATFLIIEFSSVIAIAENQPTFVLDIEVGSFNKEALESFGLLPTFSTLVKVIRDGLAHPLQKNGLTNYRTVVADFYCWEYVDYRGCCGSLSYSKANSDFLSFKDYLFGCGHFRISLLAQVVPALRDIETLVSDTDIYSIALDAHPVSS